MTQKVFASFIGLSEGSLSGIYSGRTRPTLNVVELIKEKIPAISTDWLMFGTGEMYLPLAGAQNEAENQVETGSDVPRQIQNPMLDFDVIPSTKIGRAHV